MKIKSCALCRSESLTFYPELIYSPPANNLSASLGDSLAEKKYPLGLAKCENCDHVQLSYEVDANILFSNYSYQTSVSSFFRNHFREYASTVTRKLQSCNFNTLSEYKVLDIGSNDAYLLDCFKDLGCQTFGVEPAKNLAVKTSRNHTIFNSFFTSDIAHQIESDHGKFDVIAANNVFAHTRELSSFAKGVSKLLKDENSLFIFEVQYLGSLIDDCLFDMIYHEHTSYHHLRPLVEVLPSYGLHVVDVEIINSHGGSLRVFCSNSNRQVNQSAIDTLLESEASYLSHATIDATLRLFCEKVVLTLAEISTFIVDYKSRGYTLFGYTSPAKATTLIAGLSEEARSSISFIFDDGPLKANKYIPSTSIIIHSLNSFNQVSTVETVSPPTLGDKSLCILFAWNIAESLLQKIKSEQLFPGDVLKCVLLPKPLILK